MKNKMDLYSAELESNIKDIDNNKNNFKGYSEVKSKGIIVDTPKVSYISVGGVISIVSSETIEIVDHFVLALGLRIDRITIDLAEFNENRVVSGGLHPELFNSRVYIEVDFYRFFRSKRPDLCYGNIEFCHPLERWVKRMVKIEKLLNID